MSITKAALLGLGEVGNTLAEDLLRNSDVQLRAWDYRFGDADSAAAKHCAALVDNTRFEAAVSAGTAAEGCQLIISAVTADEAVNAAESILPSIEAQTWFVDLNSVSPGTKLQLNDCISRVGGRFVEASVMSPIHPKRSSSPILLGGAFSEEFEEIGKALGFSGMRAVSESLGTAAATKMCRSVIIKGMEALVTESLLAARHYGVDDSVLESLNNLFPRDDWPDHARYLISRSLQHGKRRAAEMREVVKTVDESGLSPWMSEACVERQEWAPQFDAALEQKQLDGMLDAIRGQLNLNNKR